MVDVEVKAAAVGRLAVVEAGILAVGLGQFAAAGAANGAQREDFVLDLALAGDRPLRRAAMVQAAQQPLGQGGEIARHVDLVEQDQAHQVGGVAGLGSVQQPALYHLAQGLSVKVSGDIEHDRFRRTPRPGG